MEKQTFRTNYKAATKWLHNNLILCNEIAEVDPTVYENMDFQVEDEDGNYTEIYQYMLTDCSEFDKDYLKEHFGLKFTYSEKLNLWVLCVDHYGTSWDYVYCDTDLEEAQRELGQD